MQRTYGHPIIFIELYLEIFFVYLGSIIPKAKMSQIVDLFKFTVLIFSFSIKRENVSLSLLEDKQNAKFEGV